LPQIGSLYVGLGLDTATFDRQLQNVGGQAAQVGEKLKRGLGGASAELDKFGRSTGQTRFALQNLSFQLNDIGTSLASGGSPLRVLAQQGGQVFQIWQQSPGVFGAAARAIGGMITPTRLAIAGIAGLGLGFGALLVRAQSNSEQLRQFNLLLERTGRLSSNLDIGGENSRLRSLGISRDTANTQRLAMARIPSLNEASGERLQALGANLGARLGLGPEAGFQQLIQTISQGPEATIRFAASMRALSVDQAAALLSSARLTGGVKEQNTAIAALETKMKGFAKEAMDPLKDATNTLAGAWDTMLEGLSKTSVIQGARDAIIDMMKQIGAAASGQTVSSPTPTNLLGTGINLQGVNRSIRQGIYSGAGWLWNQLPDLGNPAANQQDMARGLASRGGSANAYLNQNAPFPTLGNPAGTPPKWTMAPAAVQFDPSRPFDTPTHGGRFWRSPSQMASGSRWNFGAGSGSVPNAGGFVSARPEGQALAVSDAIQKQREQNAAAIPIQRLWNIEQEAAAAALAKRIELQGMGATAEEQATGAALAAAAARAKFNVELGKENTLTDMRIEGDRKVAQAMLQSEAAAVRVTAAEQAKIEVLQRGGDVAKRTQQTLDALSARTEISFAQGGIRDQNDAAIIRLQVGLQGQSAEHIDRQVALLRVRQQLEAAGVPVAQSIVDARLRGVNVLHDELALLARQRQLMDQLREVAGVFENAFSRAFDSIGDGTFKLGNAIKSLATDVFKTVSSQAFKALLHGDSGSEGGGLLGSLFGSLTGGGGLGKLFGLGGGETGMGAIGGDFGGGGDLIPAFATGGSFTVGGSGAIDSQIVRFRASPDERVTVTPANQMPYGGGEPIRIELNPSEGWVSGIADQRIYTRSGQIVEVAVRQSQQQTRRGFTGYAAESQARKA
jgi:hypothetical protein